MLSGEGGGGEIHGPEDHSGCVRVDTLGGEDTAHLRLVVSQIAGRFGDEQPRESHAPTGASHIVQASAGAKVMATADASANRCAPAMAAVGKNVTADTDNQLLQAHRGFRKVI